MIAKPRRSLTPAEIDIVIGAANGQSNKQIAARRHVSIETVKYQWKWIFIKYGVPNRTAAVAIAWRECLICGDDIVRGLGTTQTQRSRSASATTSRGRDSSRLRPSRSRLYGNVAA